MMLAYPALMWFLGNPAPVLTLARQMLELLSRLCSPCLLIAMSLVGKRPPTFFPSLSCLQVNQPAGVSSQLTLVVTILLDTNDLMTIPSRHGIFTIDNGPAL